MALEAALGSGPTGGTADKSISGTARSPQLQHCLLRYLGIMKSRSDIEVLLRQHAFRSISLASQKMRISLQIIVSIAVVMVAVLIFIALCEDGLLLLLGEAGNTESEAVQGLSHQSGSGCLSAGREIEPH